MATILIVDDQKTNRFALSMLLASKGHETLEACNGLEGLKIASERVPDLALVDLLMPEVDGFEFIYRLRDGDGPAARMPIILVTGVFVPKEVESLARACGVSQILSKDTSAENLIPHVEAALRSRVPEAELPPRTVFSTEVLKLLVKKQVKELRSVVPDLASLIKPDPSTTAKSGGHSSSDSALSIYEPGE